MSQSAEYSAPRTFTPFVPAVRNPQSQAQISHVRGQPPTFPQGLGTAQFAPIGAPPAAGDQPDLSLMQNQQKSTRICRHHQRGRCTWGEHCRFVHDTPTVEAPTLQRPGPATVSSENDRALSVGIQQGHLQTMRHAKLLTALKGSYETLPSDTPGHVTISCPGVEPDTVAFLSESQMAAELRRLDGDRRFSEVGALMYLAGEPNVFYTAIRMFNTQGTCGHNRLDFSLHMAQQHDMVECMFHCSPVGCQALRCGYEHRNLYAAAQEGTLGVPLPAGFRLLKRSPIPTVKAGPTPASMALPDSVTPPVDSLYAKPMGKLSASTTSFAGLSVVSGPTRPAGSVSSCTGSTDDFVLLSDSPVLSSKHQGHRPSVDSGSVPDLSQWDTVDRSVYVLKPGPNSNVNNTPAPNVDSGFNPLTTSASFLRPIGGDGDSKGIW